MRPKKILIVTNYYHPYLSGLSFVAKVLAENLASNGIQVTVLCHRHLKTLREVEYINGVNIYRARKLLRINRATISLDFLLKYLQLRIDKDYINFHLPMPEAGLLPIKKGQKLITTYQCDVPKGNLRSNLVAFFMDISSKFTILKSKWVVFSTADYMNSSRMKKFSKTKYVEIFPFVNFIQSTAPLFVNRNGRCFGSFGRFTSEKGTLFLIEAFQNGASQNDCLLLAGSTKVMGDSVFEQVKKFAERDSRIILYPDIHERKLPSFYASLDAFCFPSLNSFEAFGIAQVEALLAGTPVLTSNLPGVRMPVELTGLGEILPVGDLSSWAGAIKRFDRNSYPKEISKESKLLFSKDVLVKKYLKLLDLDSKDILKSL